MALHLIRTSKCVDDIPIYARHVSPGREVTDEECDYYRWGYIMLHVATLDGSHHFTPLKLPDYHDAKAAWRQAQKRRRGQQTGKAGSLFGELWPALNDYHAFGASQLENFSHLFMVADAWWSLEFSEWLVERWPQLPGRADNYKRAFEEWIHTILPLCTRLPGEIPNSIHGKEWYVPS